MNRCTRFLMPLAATASRLRPQFAQRSASAFQPFVKWRALLRSRCIAAQDQYALAESERLQHTLLADGQLGRAVVYEFITASDLLAHFVRESERRLSARERRRNSVGPITDCCAGPWYDTEVIVTRAGTLRVCKAAIFGSPTKSTPTCRNISRRGGHKRLVQAIISRSAAENLRGGQMTKAREPAAESVIIELRWDDHPMGEALKELLMALHPSLDLVVGLVTVREDESQPRGHHPAAAQWRMQPAIRDHWEIDFGNA